MTFANPFERIVVGYDDSSPADVALEHALVLAQQYGGEIVVVHVSDDAIAAVIQLETAVPGRPLDLAPFLGSLDRYRYDLFQKIRARVAFVNVPVSLEFSMNDIAAGIIDAAARWRATAIAIGTHARGGMSHALIGSVAEGVVRSALVPVIVTREKMPARPLEEIVVGIDFTERSSNASSLAVALAREHPLRLVYCSVIDSTIALQPTGDISIDPSLLVEGDHITARDALDAAKQHANIEDVYPDTEIADAVDAATGIIDVARRRGADTIVVGNHRRGNLERLFLGSTAQSMMRHSHVSVIVVPAAASNLTSDRSPIPLEF